MENKKAVKFNLADPVQFLAVGFGSGLAPRAPGTFGTLAAIPLYLIIATYFNAYYLAIVLVMSIVGIFICDRAAKSVGVHDHPAIVWDEFVGFLITMFLIPLSWQSIVVGFVLFRFFDILKPWPISLADKKLTGGFGIMFDDVLAGLFALFIMHLIF